MYDPFYWLDRMLDDEAEEERIQAQKEEELFEDFLIQQYERRQ